MAVEANGTQGDAVDRPVDVFFYGLFMDVDLLRARNVNPRLVRSGLVRGFVLEIGARGTLIPQEEGSCWGLVMQILHSEIEELYSDATVSMYRPEAVKVELIDGTVAAAICFNALPNGDDRPDPKYVEQLKNLAHRLGFPAAYVRSIGSCRVCNRRRTKGNRI